MNIWKRLENIAEMGLPFLAFLLKDRAGESGLFSEIGRASCRERV